MKRFVKDITNLLENLPLLEEISITMDADITKYIESVDLIGEGSLDDTQVVEEWRTFLLAVKGYITNHPQLELLYDRPGNKLRKFPTVEGSHYYYIGVKNSDGKFVGKVVVDFRLATHQSTNKSAKARPYYEKKAMEIIQKKYPNASEVEPKGLVVNKKEFKDDYDKARFAVRGMLESIAKNYCR